MLSASITKRLVSLTASLFLLCTFADSALAQTSSRPWAIGVGFSALDYMGPHENDYFELLDRGVQLSVRKYISKGIDFTTSATYAPNIYFPNEINNGDIKRWMADMNYLLHIKFNNGLFMKESVFFAPYLTFGVGGSYTEDHPDGYIPLGMGFRFRMGQRMNMRLESLRRFSLNADHQNIAHTVAFVYNIKDKPGSDMYDPNDIPEELKEMLSTLWKLPDTDEDGVKDYLDRCPNEVGYAEFGGCPDEMAMKAQQAKDAAQAQQIKDNEQAQRASAQEQSVKKDSATYSPGEGYEEWSFTLNDQGNAPSPEIKNQEPVNEVVNSESYNKDMRVVFSSEEATTVMTSSAHRGSNPGVHSAVQSVEKGWERSSLGPNAALQPVLFESGLDELTSDSYETLDGLAEMMKENDQLQLTVNGHTDHLGSDRLNLVLSIKRAYNVKYYLVYKHGIAQNRIISGGFGEDAPIASNSSVTGRELNRRVDFKLNY